MQVSVNKRCGKAATAAEFCPLSDGVAEFWIGHDDTGRYRYGFIVEGTQLELDVVRELAEAINDQSISNAMLPGSMNDIYRVLYGS